MMSLVALALAVPLAMAGPPTVRIPTLGDLVGVLAPGKEAIGFFGGIPYAKPPVGDLRWQPPVPHGAWDVPRDASKFDNVCMQPPALTTPTTPMSEDCLFLNVAAPIEAIGQPGALPVMVWIHGGAYNTGESNDYPIHLLVTRSNLSAVIVSVNYRLNAFGFLGAHDLQQRSSDGSTGNYGLQDQQLALQWVHDHISAFGGNASQVTIFGESAGGNSVINHIARSGSGHLFARAIIESGAYDAGAIPLSDAEQSAETLMAACGCKDFDCMASLDPKVLIGQTERIAKWGPVVDGVSLPDTPLALIAAGSYNHNKPILLGSNRDEMAFFTILLKIPPQLTGLELTAMLAPRYSEAEIAELKSLYTSPSYAYPVNLGNYSKPWWMYMRMATDTTPGLGPCGVRSLARMLVDGGTPAVYTYFFTHPTQADGGGVVPGMGPGSVLVPHASEIMYVFDDAANLTPGAEADLAFPISSYWTSFALRSDPNTNGLPTWPKFTKDNDMVLTIDVPDKGGIRTISGLRKQVCDWMDTHIRME